MYFLFALLTWNWTDWLFPSFSQMVDFSSEHGIVMFWPISATYSLYLTVEVTAVKTVGKKYIQQFKNIYIYARLFFKYGEDINP